jgi:hypothetical protein
VFPLLFIQTLYVTVRVTLQLAVCHQSVRLGSEPLEIHGQNFLSQLNTCTNSPYIKSSMTRGWVIIYNCCWPSPGQSFWGLSPVGLATIFYCLRFETSLLSPPTTRRATVVVFDPTSTREIVRVKFKFKVQNHIATDGRSNSMSWCRTPSGAHDEIFIIHYNLPVFMESVCCLFVSTETFVEYLFTRKPLYNRLVFVIYYFNFVCKPLPWRSLQQFHQNPK